MYLIDFFFLMANSSCWRNKSLCVNSSLSHHVSCMPHTDSDKKNELESIAAAFLVELKPNNPLSSYFSKSDDAVSLILGDHSPHSVKKKKKRALSQIYCAKFHSCNLYLHALRVSKSSFCLPSLPSVEDPCT